VPGPTLYFDRNVGWRVPEALRLLGHTVVHHNTRRKSLGLKEKSTLKTLFTPAEKDDVWLEYVGQKGWLVFTQDRKFHRAGFENKLSAIKQFNVGCFYIWGADANKWEKMKALCKGLDSMIVAADLTPRPFIYDVQKNGKLIPVPIP